MLKGSKIDNCQWSIQPISTKNFLTFEKDPSMYLQFQANKLIHNLQKVVESVDHFKYYMFSYKNEIRFLFITSEDVNFASVDKYSNRQETTFGIIVRGALYDIAFNRFIRFDGSRKGDVFYNFVIYDCGIPHIVFDEENESYVIGCSNRNRWTFLRTEYHEGPVLVSHIHFNENRIGCDLTRVVFFKSDDGEDKMIVLQNELDQVMTEDSVQYENVFYNCSEANSEQHYYHLVHGDLATSGEFINQVEELGIIHITEDDCLIVRDSDTEDFSILYLNTVVEHDLVNDFFDYSVIDSTEYDYETYPMRIKITYRKDDFENSTAIIDCIKRKVILT